MNIPDRFTFNVPANKRNCLAEKQPDGSYLVQWPKYYTGDSGQSPYSKELVTLFVKGGEWKIIADLDAPTKPVLSFAEKCKALQLTIASHDDYISIHNVSVKAPADLEKLVDLLYEARRD